MKILVINTGSSSIKYQLFEMTTGKVLAAGLLEKIGETSSRLTHQKAPESPEATKIVEERAIGDHRQGLEQIVDLLTDAQTGVIRDTAEISGVGHRVVHGGETFHRPTLIDEAVLDAIRENVPLAPLHNPANLVGIEVARALFAQVPHVAVFDTAFHQTIPPHAFHYALPYDFYTKYRIRRYGFHGTSHQYVAHQAAQFLGKPLREVNLITIHLGNGASITAIENGQSIDTSMGMTPLEGVIMGTRCGDLDPAIPFYLATEAGMSLKEMDNVMNKQSGLKGLCGLNDMRDIMAKQQEGDARAALALKMYNYRIKKYIGAYYAVLGRVDALVFTAGIGQNAAEVRTQACAGLERLGITIDAQKNQNRAQPFREIQADGATVKVLVIPTNEELEIAEETLEVLKAL